MKILTATQIRNADHFTIENEPIAAIALMERAAKVCFKWIEERHSKNTTFHIVCGTGNNGGDGLAIARMLWNAGYECQIFKIPLGKESIDFQINENRLPTTLYTMTSHQDLPEWNDNENVVIIDSLLGIGAGKPPAGLLLECIQKINQSGCKVVSIDMPSGLYSEFNDARDTNSIVQATETLSFQLPKLSFLLPEAGTRAGEFHLLDIGLHSDFIDKVNTPYQFLEGHTIQKLLKKRFKFSHKGSYGHLLLVAGSEGKMGAAVLAANAGFYSGVGKLTVHSPKCGLAIIQSTVVEAMVEVNSGEKTLSGTLKQTESTLAIGPGIGTADETGLFLKSVLKQSNHPLVLDADALNLLAKNKDWLTYLPENSILTPHPKEFERLVSPWRSDREKLDCLTNFCRQWKCICVIKGAHTVIGLPDGTFYFNSTGNPGMATAGSGDVLTGILGGFLAQGYSPKQVALLGVYLHGLAGDHARKQWGIYSMTAGHINQGIPDAFREITI